MQWLYINNTVTFLILIKSGSIGYCFKKMYGTLKNSGTFKLKHCSYGKWLAFLPNWGHAFVSRRAWEFWCLSSKKARRGQRGALVLLQLSSCSCPAPWAVKARLVEFLKCLCVAVGQRQQPRKFCLVDVDKVFTFI